ncbi:MAG: relaxase/mobilization nuclease domain-containing protein [Candidatus Saccharibacteria bacterium]|nr:relaxase/mobilization nuclease domain-containing protein [Candidatus Saccharibacteria bacterium]
MTSKVLGAELHDVLNPYGKRKAGTSKEKISFGRPAMAEKQKKSSQSTAEGVASGHAEVMVKITKFSKGAKAARAHLLYISRNMQLEIENQAAEKLHYKDDIKDVINEWSRTINDEKAKENTRTAMHMMLSMPPGTDPGAVKNGAREFAHELFAANHDYLFVLHTDKKHPHVHLVVRTLGHDGKRLNPRKADLMEYRQVFAAQMRRQGVDAVASVRQGRGNVQKADHSPIEQMGKRLKKSPDAVQKHSVILDKRQAEAVGELIDAKHNKQPPEKPWIDKIAEKRNTVVDAWKNFSTSLASLPAPIKRISINEIRSGVIDNRRKAQVYAENRTKELHDKQRPEGRGWSNHADRGANLHQSDYRVSGRVGKTTTTTSLRSMPSVNVVYHRGRAEMLLLKDAHANVGSLRHANTGMRRSSTRDGTILSRNKRNGDGRITVDDVRLYVERLEKKPILTRNEELKSKLREQFTLGKEQFGTTNKVSIEVGSKQNNKPMAEPNKTATEKSGKKQTRNESPLKNNQKSR